MLKKVKAISSKKSYADNMKNFDKFEFVKFYSRRNNI